MCLACAVQMVQHSHYSEKVDIFSLGCLIYELFSRQLCASTLLAKSGGDERVLKRHALQVHAQQGALLCKLMLWALPLQCMQRQWERICSVLGMGGSLTASTRLMSGIGRKGAVECISCYDSNQLRHALVSPGRWPQVTGCRCRIPSRSHSGS